MPQTNKYLRGSNCRFVLKLCVASDIVTIEERLLRGSPSQENVNKISNQDFSFFSLFM